ncbi:MAG: L-rhamnose isomerase, partial [Limisphaerales bacterium]
KQNGLGLDFNPTCFSHPKAADGFTLSHHNKGIRQFWIEHCSRCRDIGAIIGKSLGKACITNIWIPDGMKDSPADRNAPRERLARSLDAIFKKPLPPRWNLDAIEPKLFGIGSESYVVGSHEFYLGYAVSRKKLLTLDAGHYHPTEGIPDKISSVLQFIPEILLHVSRGVRWDSDHIVILNDDLLSIAREIVANGFLGRVHIGLDYFDASVNRIAAWTIGARNMVRSLLIALLEPSETLRAAEKEGDYTTRLVLQEEMKSMPFGAIWDFYCEMKGVPVGESWLAELKRHEKEVLAKRT